MRKRRRVYTSMNLSPTGSSRRHCCMARKEIADIDNNDNNEYIVKGQKYRVREMITEKIL